MKTAVLLLCLFVSSASFAGQTYTWPAKILSEIRTDGANKKAIQFASLNSTTVLVSNDKLSVKVGRTKEANTYTINSKPLNIASLPTVKEIEREVLERLPRQEAGFSFFFSEAYAAEGEDALTSLKELSSAIVRLMLMTTDKESCEVLVEVEDKCEAAAKELSKISELVHLSEQVQQPRTIPNEKQYLTRLKFFDSTLFSPASEMLEKYAWPQYEKRESLIRRCSPEHKTKFVQCTIVVQSLKAGTIPADLAKRVKDLDDLAARIQGQEDNRPASTTAKTPAPTETAK